MNKTACVDVYVSDCDWDLGPDALSVSAASIDFLHLKKMPLAPVGYKNFFLGVQGDVVHHVVSLRHC
ncbi:hypothetical protein ACOSQ2_029788 [Xanthoceras sorbifolium]